MLNKNKSVLLTHFMVRCCYVLLAAAIIVLPIMLREGNDSGRINLVSEVAKYVIGPFYAIVPFGYAALVCIDKLLINIRKRIVFDNANVKLLRIISLCCFSVVAICLAAIVAIQLTTSYTYHLGLIVLGSGALFMGLVLRVVMNIFEAAIELKEENDLTI